MTFQFDSLMQSMWICGWELWLRKTEAIISRIVWQIQCKMYILHRKFYSMAVVIFPRFFTFIPLPFFVFIVADHPIEINRICIKEIYQTNNRGCAHIVYTCTVYDVVCIHSLAHSVFRFNSAPEFACETDTDGS